MIVVLTTRSESSIMGQYSLRVPVLALVPQGDCGVWLAQEAPPLLPRPPPGARTEHDLAHRHVLPQECRPALDLEDEADLGGGEVPQGESGGPAVARHGLLLV